LKSPYILAVLLWAASVASPAAAQTQSDWERARGDRDWKESEVGLPDPPTSGALIEFFVSAGSNFRFFIDRASISVGTDGVVRYTLVARSPSGAENTSYEGIRCSSASYKVYAVGQGAGWSRARSDWKPIEAKSVQRWHQALRDEYFCPFNVLVSSAAQAVEHLRRGGHPDFRRKN
jgi:hypothetical protein